MSKLTYRYQIKNANRQVLAQESSKAKAVQARFIQGAAYIYDTVTGQSLNLKGKVLR